MTAPIERPRLQEFDCADLVAIIETAARTLRGRGANDALHAVLAAELGRDAARLPDHAAPAPIHAPPPAAVIEAAISRHMLDWPETPFDAYLFGISRVLGTLLSSQPSEDAPRRAREIGNAVARSLERQIERARAAAAFRAAHAARQREQIH